MAHPLDYENYDHLCRLRHALRSGTSTRRSNRCSQTSSG